MKKPVLILLALAALCPTAVLATIGSITTLTGRTYRKCEIVRVHPDGVSFTHANGAAKVLFMDLSPSWRARLGYSPAKAAAYEKELSEKRRRETEARAARQAELSRAMILAQEMELTRLRIAEQQATAAARAAAQNYNFPAGSAFPLLPPLGAVFDSREYRYGPRSYRSNRPVNGVWYLPGSGVNPQFGVSAAPFCPPRKGSFSYQVSP